MENFDSLALELHKAKQARKYFEALEKECLDKLLASTNNNAFKGSKFELQSKKRLGSVNYSLIPELRNVNVNLYRKEGITTWYLVENVELPDMNNFTK